MNRGEPDPAERMPLAQRLARLRHAPGTPKGDLAAQRLREALAEIRRGFLPLDDPEGG